MVRIFASWCIVVSNHDAISRPGTRNLAQSFLEPPNITIVLCIVIYDLPVRNLCELVRQMSALKRYQILSNAMFGQFPCRHPVAEAFGYTDDFHSITVASITLQVADP